MCKDSKDVVLDGTYPFDNRKQDWQRVMPISRELAYRMLDRPHFQAHDNGFLNKGYKIVSVDGYETTTFAVYHHDGKFSVIKTSNFEVRQAAVEKYGDSILQLMGTEPYCPGCYIPMQNTKYCPHCKRVLHLEDDSRMKSAIARAFKGCFVTLIQVSTVDEAAAVLIEGNVDLLLSDWNLEYGTSASVLEAARIGRIPTILHTAMPPKDVEVDLVVTKGGSISELVDPALRLVRP